MTSASYDVQIPATEQQIAEAIRWSSDPDADTVRRLAFERDRLKEELLRLRSGKWTPEEIHSLCHNLPQTVPVCEFAAGCAAEQRKIYGAAPDAEDAARWRYVRKNGCRSFAMCVDEEVLMLHWDAYADAAVD